MRELINLRHQLGVGKMSAMIGAGFSLNVSPTFMSWESLLIDLTKNLYESPLTEAFETAKKRNRLRRIDKESFMKREAAKIIRETGYLEIVSQYIQKKKFYESIVTYIEERTPYIESKGDKFNLCLNDEINDLPSEKLFLHRLLVELPWNNIYTTNYDNLIEIVADTNRYDELQKQREEILNDIEFIEIRKADLKRESYATASNQVFPISMTSNISPVATAPFGQWPDSTETAKRNQKKIELQQIEGNISAKYAELKQVEAKMAYAYTVVDNAKMLRLKRNRNIIKLHGSIRLPKQRQNNFFQFDGDPSVQYIIANEHYVDYPQKHEAFTQLMRISLLQEAFCLIGFSGVDPNFLGWIEWIRDLLYKPGPLSNDKEKYKIYLIDMDSDETPADKALFYQNHGILRVKLLSLNVLKFLEDQTGLKHDKQNKHWSALQIFLRFLSSHDDLTEIVPGEDLASERAIQRAWLDFNIHDGISEPKLEQLASRLKDVSSNVGYPNLWHSNTINQFWLISYSTDVIGFAPETKAYVLQLQVLANALESYYLPISDAVNINIIQALLKEPTTKLAAERMLSRNKSLQPTIPWSEDDGEVDNGYQQILRQAFSFQFKALKNSIENWQAPPNVSYRKAGFLAFFDMEIAENYLSSILESPLKIKGSSRLYLVEMLDFIQRGLRLRRDKTLSLLIEKYKQAGYRSIHENFYFLRDEVLGREATPKPYGKNRFVTSIGESHRTHETAESALRYLYLLSDSGFQLSLQHEFFEDWGNWHVLYEVGLKYYPWPFVFYTLQITKSGAQQRAAQDLIYQDLQKEHTDQICIQLLQNLSDAPTAIINNILYFLSELFIAVDPLLWQDPFLSIWENRVTEGQALGNRDDAERAFISKGLDSLTSVSHLYRFLTTLLVVWRKNATVSIIYTYNLNKNKQLTAAKSEDLPNDLLNLLDALIDNLNEEDEDVFFVLGNLNFLLSDYQRKRIQEYLRQANMSFISNERIWHILVYFANGDREINGFIKNAIINNKKLWYNGIDGRSITSGPEHLISLEKVTKVNPKSKGLRWKKRELVTIYRKMCSSFDQIYAVRDRWDNIAHFENELQEMSFFIERHVASLNGLNNFVQYKSMIYQSFIDIRGFESLADGLVNMDRNKVITALALFSRDIFLKKADGLIISILLNKILLFAEPCLEETLNYVAVWLEDEQNATLFTLHLPVIQIILRTYKENIPSHVERSFFEEFLSRIALAVHRMGSVGQEIDFWRKKPLTSRFNNVKKLQFQIIN